MSYIKPKSTYSLPNRYCSTPKHRTKRAPMSMYSSPQFLPRNNINFNSVYLPPSECSLYSNHNRQSLNQNVFYNQIYASSLPYESKFDADFTNASQVQVHAADKVFVDRTADELDFSEYYKNNNYYLSSFKPEENFVCKDLDKEPIYYDCGNETSLIEDNVLTTPLRVAPINFDVQSLTIEEEYYGDV